MECFNEYYVGEIVNFMRKCRFYRKTGCKMKKMEGDLFWWRMIFRNEIPNRVRNDDITTFGMTLWQYSGWRIFFWFWNITCYASGWGWWCDNIWIFTYKLHKEKYDFNLAIKQTICCRGNMKNWWNSINLYSQFSCDCFCIISHNIKKRTYFIK